MFIETSAKTGYNVKQVRRPQQHRPPSALSGPGLRPAQLLRHARSWTETERMRENRGRKGERFREEREQRDGRTLKEG